MENRKRERRKEKKEKKGIGEEQGSGEGDEVQGKLERAIVFCSQGRVESSCVRSCMKMCFLRVVKPHGIFNGKL